MAVTINGAAWSSGAAPPTGALLRRRDDTGESWTWTLRMRGDVGTTTEVKLPDVPTRSKLELVECVLVAADGAAVSVRPALGTAPGWTIDDKDHVVRASTAAASHRIQSNGAGALVTLPVLPNGAALYVRPVPDVQLGASGDIFLRVTLRVGGA